MRPFRIKSSEVHKISRAFLCSVPATSLQVQFHMHVWGAICEYLGTNRGHMFIGDVVLFSDATDRRAFERFWKRYREWFAGQHESAFMPQVPKGILGRAPAAFVPDERPSLDGRLHFWNGTFSDDPTANASRIDGSNPWKALLPIWMWFPMRCRAPVYRLQGGWLFSDAKDAAKWTLFAEERVELVRRFDSERFSL